MAKYRRAEIYDFEQVAADGPVTIDATKSMAVSVPAQAGDMYGTGPDGMRTLVKAAEFDAMFEAVA